MAWYWWVLIAVAVIVGGYIKVKVFTRMMNAKKEQPDQSEDM